MTDSKTNDPQPNRPLMRGADRYAILTDAAKAVVSSVELFSLHISAIKKEGEGMDDETRFLVDLLFKPNETGFKLRPAETQLLLGYIGEILAEVAAEEKQIIDEQNSLNGKDNTTCK
jgi:hypothetical protein